jgi:four helix bundle protein
MKDSITKLEVWKRSIKLVTKIYKPTNKYPSEERYGLVTQMRRSAYRSLPI